jgi:hypothetical protein
MSAIEMADFAEKERQVSGLQIEIDETRTPVHAAIFVAMKDVPHHPCWKTTKFAPLCGRVGLFYG